MRMVREFSLVGKRKIYLNTRQAGVVTYKRVKKINGIRYITYDTEQEIIERLGKLIMEEDEFDIMCKEDYKKTYK